MHIHFIVWLHRVSLQSPFLLASFYVFLVSAPDDQSIQPISYTYIRIYILYCVTGSLTYSFVNSSFSLSNGLIIIAVSQPYLVSRLSFFYSLLLLHAISSFQTTFSLILLLIHQHEYSKHATYAHIHTHRHTHSMCSWIQYFQLSFRLSSSLGNQSLSMTLSDSFFLLFCTQFYTNPFLRCSA